MSQTHQTLLSQKILLTQEQFETSYSYANHGKTCGEFLANRGVFDGFKGALKYGNRKLPIISLLGLYTHFSGMLYAGAITTQNTFTKFDADLGKSGRQISQLLPVFEEELGLSFHSKERSYRFKENGKVYARLLHLLGFSASMPLEREFCFNQNTKTQRNAQLPLYLLALEEEFLQLGKNDQRLARKYLRDVVAVLFDSCIKEYDKKDSNSILSLRVMSRRTPEQVREEASTLIKIMNCAYPNLNSSLEKHFSLIAPEKAKAYYQGLIKFGPEDLARVSTPEIMFPAKQAISIEPRFSYQFRKK